MKSFYAAAERATEDALMKAVDVSSHNPVIDGLMKSVSGLVAILNPQRQILSVNDSALEELGIDDLESVVGLRPGQAIHCIHANEEPAGCGTTPHCASCGAAIAMVSAIKHDRPAERFCAATVEKDGRRDDRCFKVQAIPVYFDECRFILLFMQDITEQQSWSELESSFFHDLNNILSGLMGTSELLFDDFPGNEDVRSIRTMVRRLSKDIELHQMLILASDSRYTPSIEPIRIAHLIDELRFNLKSSSCALGKRLNADQLDSSLTVASDHSLLRRILLNMLTNAFEATEPGGTVRFRAEQNAEQTVLCVWNSEAIPEEVKPRIFQRYYTTKEGGGHGLGTYSMKLFAETVLDGSITFSSSAGDGTVFRLALPRNPVSAGQV